MKRRKVVQALKRKGFVGEQSHHTYYYFYGKDGENYGVRTYVSHGGSGGDISDSLISQMAKQCRLSKSDFQKLIDCTLSYEEYEEKVRIILSK